MSGERQGAEGRRGGGMLTAYKRTRSVFADRCEVVRLSPQRVRACVLWWRRKGRGCFAPFSGCFNARSSRARPDDRTSLSVSVGCPRSFLRHK